MDLLKAHPFLPLPQHQVTFNKNLEMVQKDQLEAAWLLAYETMGLLTVSSTAQAWPAASLQPNMSATGSHQSRPLTSFSHLSTNLSSSSKSKPTRVKESFPSSHVKIGRASCRERV